MPEHIRGAFDATPLLPSCLVRWKSAVDIVEKHIVLAGWIFKRVKGLKSQICKAIRGFSKFSKLRRCRDNLDAGKSKGLKARKTFGEERNPVKRMAAGLCVSPLMAGLCSTWAELVPMPVDHGMVMSKPARSMLAYSWLSASVYWSILVSPISHKIFRESNLPDCKSGRIHNACVDRFRHCTAACRGRSLPRNDNISSRG